LKNVVGHGSAVVSPATSASPNMLDNINQYSLPNLHWIYSESFVANLPSSGADILFENLVTVVYY